MKGIQFTLLILGTALSANATSLPGYAVGITPAISTQDRGTSGNLQAQVIGWEFRPTVDINVKAMGLFDSMGPFNGDTDGLADPHDLGLWTSSGELLRLVTIPEGTSTNKIDNFRYIDITPILLESNQNYVIGAFFTGVPGRGYGAIDPDPDRDYYHSGYNNPDRTYAPEISFVNNRISSQQISGIRFPYDVRNRFVPDAQAPLGPSFLFEQAKPVPEPATIFGLATVLGCGALLKLENSKKKNKS